MRCTADMHRCGGWLTTRRRAGMKINNTAYKLFPVMLLLLLFSFFFFGKFWEIILEARFRWRRFWFIRAWLRGCAAFWTRRPAFDLFNTVFSSFFFSKWRIVWSTLLCSVPFRSVRFRSRSIKPKHNRIAVLYPKYTLPFQRKHQQHKHVLKLAPVYYIL